MVIIGTFQMVSCFKQVGVSSWSSSWSDVVRFSDISIKRKLSFCNYHMQLIFSCMQHMQLLNLIVP